MDSEIDGILEQKEQVVWKGTINRNVLNARLVISFILAFLVAGFLFSRETINYTSNGMPSSIKGPMVAIVVFALWAAGTLLWYFSGRVKEYALTKKRIIIKSGLIGTDFESVYYTEIKNILVNVGIIGKVFGVGTVKIDTGKTATYSDNTVSYGKRNTNMGHIRTKTLYAQLEDIDNPYEVYKIIQSSLSNRVESLYSGRADRESNPDAFAKS